jgi:hypothetical protein
MWAWFTFGSFALAPNSVDDVRRKDWKLTAVVFSPLTFVATPTPALIAAGFNTRRKKLAGRIWTCFRIDPNSQALGAVSNVSKMAQFQREIWRQIHYTGRSECLGLLGFAVYNRLIDDQLTRPHVVSTQRKQLF